MQPEREAGTQCAVPAGLLPAPRCPGPAYHVASPPPSRLLPPRFLLLGLLSPFSSNPSISWHSLQGRTTPASTPKQRPTSTGLTCSARCTPTSAASCPARGRTAPPVSSIHGRRGGMAGWNGTEQNTMACRQGEGAFVAQGGEGARFGSCATLANPLSKVALFVHLCRLQVRPAVLHAAPDSLEHCCAPTTSTNRQPINAAGPTCCPPCCPCTAAC